MDKQTVITILEEIALFLELNNENPFKIRAYANGARVLQSQPDDLETLVQPKKLESLKGIGKGLSENIRELVRTGKLEYYEELKKTVPKGLLELMTIPGLGPRKAKALYEKLDVHSIGELEYACHENRLLKLEGFGQKSQDKILKGIEYLKKSSGKFLISEAENEACKTVEYLKTKGCSQDRDCRFYPPPQRSNTGY